MAGARRVVCESEEGLVDVCCGLLWVYVVRGDALVLRVAIPLSYIRSVDAARGVIHLLGTAMVGDIGVEVVRLPCRTVRQRREIRG